VNPNIVTILTSGAPNDLGVVNRVSKALLLSWFNGSEGGNALADVLLGTISPSGRLPFTLPVKLEDSPAYALGNYPQGGPGSDVFASLVARAEAAPTAQEPGKSARDPNRAYYSEESLVGYRWFDTRKVPVMYPFGHGLTYTSFEYARLGTDRTSYHTDDVIRVTIELKNRGKMTADEVVQLYVHRVDPSVEWPEKELKAFARNTLRPGESRTVRLEVPAASLRYWNEGTRTWNDDPCMIELRVGPSAGDIRLKKRVSLR
jgi:beta-glucosidase